MQVTQRDLNTILNKRWRIEHLYKIKSEDSKLVNFRFNEVQEALWEYAEDRKHRGLSIIIDKSRKQGVSTFWLLYYLDDTLWTPHTTSFIMAHTRDDVQKLFKIVKLAYNECPRAVKLESGYTWPKPTAKYDNKNELSFDGINSTIYVGLENRGDTINNLHVSEAAHIKDAEKRMTATLGAVPENGRSNTTIESTANGVGDWFQETYSECETDSGPYFPFFFGWWQKADNFITPLPDYTPSPEVLLKAALIKARHGVKISPGQMCWWDKTKSKQRKKMDQEHPTVAEESFLTSAGMVFDPEAMQKIAPAKPIMSRPIKVETRERREDGTFKLTHETFQADIYVLPKPGRRYVLGGDPSEGVGGDSSVAEIIDAVTLEQVEEFKSDKIKPAQFAIVVDNLCRYYNNALAAVERNNHGHLVLDRLKDIYGNIFIRLVLDEKTKKQTRKLGWETNSATRDLILDEFEQLVADLSVKINSAILKSEMLTFVSDDTGRREAKQGKHDDTIIAFAIALKVARMPRTSFDVQRLN